MSPEDDRSFLSFPRIFLLRAGAAAVLINELDAGRTDCIYDLLGGLVPSPKGPVEGLREKWVQIGWRSHWKDASALGRSNQSLRRPTNLEVRRQEVLNRNRENNPRQVDL
jgi:hypothetical protein